MTNPKTGWPYSWVTAFQNALGPISRLPTWANEPLTAFALMPLLLWWNARWALAVFLVLSHLYEHFLDPWGYDPEDPLWRAYGAGLVMTVYLLLWRH